LLLTTYPVWKFTWSIFTMAWLTGGGATAPPPPPRPIARYGLACLPLIVPIPQGIRSRCPIRIHSIPILHYLWLQQKVISQSVVVLQLVAALSYSVRDSLFFLASVVPHRVDEIFSKP
jgi:hypothetical protein